MTENLIDALLGHATPEWQQLLILCVFIILVPGTGLTQVLKILNPFEYYDESLPANWYKRRIQGTGIVLAFGASLFILPVAASGGDYAVVQKVFWLGVMNAVLCLWSYDFIRWALAKVKAVFDLFWASWKARKKKEITDAGGEVPDTDTEYNRTPKP